MLNYIKKKRFARRRTENSDCSVGNVRCGCKKYVSIFFYNDSCKRIAPDVEYMIFAFENGRIYFEKSDREIGYKIAELGTTGLSHTKLVKFQSDINFQCRKYGNLEYDKDYGLYFLRIE